MRCQNTIITKVYYTNMKKLSHSEIQKASICVLEKIHTFCLKNNLRYSIAYGTLIGAARHKGFIPWDDDIDIVLPRPDYDRLIRSYQDSDTKIFASELGNCYLNFARICDMKDTIAVAYTPWANEQTGIWVDIFPIDGLDETRESFINKLPEINRITSLLFQVRGAQYAKLSWNLIKNIKIIGKRILFRNHNVSDVLKQYNNVLRKQDFETSKFCAQTAYIIYNKKEFQLSDNYREYTDIEFEGRLFKCVKKFDAVLRNYYNDYMQLPPLDQQVPKHSDNIIYWK